MKYDQLVTRIAELSELTHLPKGTVVFTFKEEKPSDEMTAMAVPSWMATVKETRRWGVMSVISSHEANLYTVRHLDDKTVSCYSRDELWVVQNSRQHVEFVRRVMYALADALVELPRGEIVRTPIGVFRMTLRKARNVLLPLRPTKEMAIPAEMVIKLRAGKRLRKPPPG